jgi:hypothetical protein
MELKEIKSFLESPAGKSMKEYLEARLKSLGSIYFQKDLDDPIEIAIELKAQKKAHLVLQHILDDIISVETQKENEEKPEEDSLVPGV